MRALEEPPLARRFLKPTRNRGLLDTYAVHWEVCHEYTYQGAQFKGSRALG